MRPVIPQQLYKSTYRIVGFNPFDELGLTLTVDFARYRQFMLDGGPIPPSLEVRTARADHDAAIADALCADFKRYLDKITFSEDLSVVMGVLQKHDEKAHRNLVYALSAQTAKIGSFRMNRVQRAMACVFALQ